MVGKLKRDLYFPIASYFKFWALIQLKLWKPRIFLITGSSGKTTLLHLIESQLEDKARYSHKANSSFGIPFDILGLKRKTLSKLEWPMLFLQAPFKAFKKPFQENIYIVEADCDRPGEGQFLGSMLKPEVTMWLDVSKTHTLNFGEKARKRGIPVEEIVAQEFGYFVENTKLLSLINGDDENLVEETRRASSQIKSIKIKDLQSYKVSLEGTEFKFDDRLYKFNVLLPKETFYALVMSINLANHLDLEIDSNFANFKLPPGRSSLFKGIKTISILDSSYNASLSSMTAILEMYAQIKVSKKWAVLSDMTELGLEEESEHQKLAVVIANCQLDKIILMGPRMKKYTFPKLQNLTKTEIITFETPKEVLDYLEQNISGGETILFKGARFLEGVIEHLLLNKEDVKKLCRREEVCEKRRKDWGL